MLIAIATKKSANLMHEMMKEAAILLFFINELWYHKH